MVKQEGMHATSCPLPGALAFYDLSHVLLGLCHKQHYLTFWGFPDPCSSQPVSSARNAFQSERPSYT